MKNPVIHYQGRDVEVTPDTAAELVGIGEAILVSGSLPEPAGEQPEEKPTKKPRKPRTRKPAKT